MNVCPDCLRADAQPAWPLYRDVWCCRARMVVEMVGRSAAGLTRNDVRREAAARIRDAYPDEWAKTKERMEWLMRR